MAELQPANENTAQPVFAPEQVTAEELIKAQPLNPYVPLVFSKLSNKEPLAPKNVHQPVGGEAPATKDICH